MTKTLEQVLLENYPNYIPYFHGCVQDDGDGPYFRRDIWPSELGTAPTDAQLTEWMNE
tara:strand:- start:1358 stop:1531 length:174 start_codon:yes stop_codon:yes gene_type:complete